MCGVGVSRDHSQGVSGTSLMTAVAVGSIFFLIFFECWESCKEEEPPQDINMAVPCVPRSPGLWACLLCNPRTRHGW